VIHAPFQHSEIVAQQISQLYNMGNIISIVTEYRADGCVTWREVGK
jgi:hypothetical protein